MHPPCEPSNDTLKPTGATFKEVVGLYGWTAPGAISIVALGKQNRPRLNVGR
jgi:hypothetical protein